MSLAVPAFAEYYEDEYEEPYDGPFYIFSPSNIEGLADLSIELVSDDVIDSVWTESESCFVVPQGTRLIIDLSLGTPNERQYLEFAYVKMGTMVGEPVRQEYVYEFEDSNGETQSYTSVWYERTYDYTTLLDYDHAKGGLITGENHIVYTFDTPGDYQVDYDFNRYVRGSNGMASYSPMRIVVAASEATPPPAPEAPSSWATVFVDAAFATNLVPVMLSRLADALGKPLPKTASTFSDNSSVETWAIDQVGQVQAAEIMSGVGENRFAPKDSYTREQSIITIIRLFDLVNSDK